ncbi:hypothetical protein [Mycolicibacterium fluoranthenivorans]|uniref:Uncharacterized protein n=1 Tax=Mycolicibacterium fluoranthenivorans TaxID=258505 RepID=A0A1G4WKS9_9MYCO|nr:hypothetical protein [Mycolicibacterium fluoranthenivorans]SCX24759.1 hypothetical protein SAMN02799620_03771 [Mycolicibacterium fluoranthenivorans]
MSDRERQAICCTCGTVRTCKRARNHREENYWLNQPVDLDWHRETGDLKCAECCRVTTHALLHPEGDWAVDHAEMMQCVATGNSHSRFNDRQLSEIRAKYRQGLPRNPELHHFWWTSEAKEAWDAGRRTVTGLCGETMKISRDPGGPSASSRADKRDDSQIAPKRFRDQEYEDPETGLWWAEVDCVDCLRVWHLELLRQRRVLLAEKTTEFLAALLADKSGYPKKIDLQTVNSLIEAIDQAQQHLGVTTQDASK